MSVRLQNLRCPIVPGSTHQTSDGSLRVVFDLKSQTQVSQDSAIRPVHEHVLQLDIVVGDIMLVEVFYCAGDMGHVAVDASGILPAAQLHKVATCIVRHGNDGVIMATGSHDTGHQMMVRHGLAEGIEE